MTKIIRLPAVVDKTGEPRSSIYRMIKNKKFPKQIKLGERSVGWVEAEVNAWIEKKVNESRCGGIK